jgi:hypothetical protein
MTSFLVTFIPAVTRQKVWEAWVKATVARVEQMVDGDSGIHSTGF